MKTIKQVKRLSGLIENVCEHGVGHPDPKSIAEREKNGPPGNKNTWGVHGCDGCCHSR